VRVEGIYSREGGGYLFDFAVGERRVLAGAPMLAVVGTDVRDKVEDLNTMRGVKVPLPTHIRRVAGGDELRMLPVKRLLFSRECSLEVEGEMDAPQMPGSDRAPQLATLTTAN
jgi:hypothetical protein